MGAIGAPDVREYAGAFERYVARVRDVSDPLAELVAQRARVVARLSRLTDEQGAFRYASGKWSIKELINHLSDAERVFAYRMLRIGRGDRTPLPGFEENDYAKTAGSDARTVADLVSELKDVRASRCAVSVRSAPTGSSSVTFAT